MPHVTGIGGVFFKAKGDPKALTAWYEKNLGIKINAWGTAVFRWAEDPGAAKAATAWVIRGKDSDQFKPSDAPFMVNYRVDDLAGLVANLEKAGIKTLDGISDSDFGKFASVLDPEGNRVELWEPK